MPRGQIRLFSAPLDSSIPKAKEKYVPTSGTYPKGFTVSGTHVGVKPSNTKHPDLTLIASDRPCSAAAVFTTNQFQAAPVRISRDILRARHGQGIRGIIINSGCANAVTGKKGDEDALAMARTASWYFSQGAEEEDKLDACSSIVMSTGVIGQQLPIQKILDKVPEGHKNLASSHQAWLTAARSICTTDTFPKLLSTTFTLPGPSHKDIIYSLAGMTKGAGMIHPNMATLLAILCTDAPIAPTALFSLLKTAADKSFNCISIDGDTSTNDTLAVLANGAAQSSSKATVPDNPNDPDYIAFSHVLTDFSQRLSQLVVRDGEGATKFIQVRVRHALTDADAKSIASMVARSPLVKTALYGRDANWGRILCAIGNTPGLSDSDASVVPRKTNVSFVPARAASPDAANNVHAKNTDNEILQLLRNGEPEVVDEARAARLLQDEDLIIDVDLGQTEDGKQRKREGSASYWFCDLSHEYVTINGDYRT